VLLKLWGLLLLSIFKEGRNLKKVIKKKKMIQKKNPRPGMVKLTYKSRIKVKEVAVIELKEKKSP